jgi:hypothetical protein
MTRQKRTRTGKGNSSVTLNVETEFLPLGYLYLINLRGKSAFCLRSLRAYPGLQTRYSLSWKNAFASTALTNAEKKKRRVRADQVTML